MNEQTYDSAALLKIRSKFRKPFELTVSGVSMLPILRDGDVITVCAKDSYEIGDILVFIYKHNEILVHRLLRISGDRYYCKGDNAFRLEDIAPEQIIGAVITENDPHRTEEYVKDSYSISRVFRKCRYDIEKTKQTPEYIQYREKYLEEK